MQSFNPDRIVERRRSLRKTQHLLATETGLSSTAIYYIEKGRRVPSAKTLSKLAYALKCEVAYFFDKIPNSC
jgi:transcriptional regulator with XRE-family HTH domain